MEADNDDDDVAAIKDTATQATRIVFGSLEHAAPEILAQGISGPAAALETEELTKESREVKERRDALLKELEVKRRTRTVPVPTVDAEVKKRLRELGLPATLFGEGPYDRRERLKQETARLEATQSLPPTSGVPAAAQRPVTGSDGQQQQPFFTPGSQELYQARVHIARDSFTRAKQRLGQERERYEQLKGLRKVQRQEEREAAVRPARKFVCHGSQVGGDRPLHCCAISPSGQKVLTGSWDMQVRLWRLPQCAKAAAFHEHKDRVTGVAWSPLDEAVAPLHFASGSADGTVKLWAIDRPASLGTLAGHQDRVCNVAFHPCGQYLGSTSYDKTWRLWDVSTQLCLLEQEGHAAEVYAIDFHCDGSLACTTDLSGIGRIWDLRSGRSILLLEGHVKQMLTCSFSPNGYHLVSGSDDNTCKVWDLRRRSALYTIAAHANVVSTAKYQPTTGAFIATASYDQTVKLWDAATFALLKTLRGHQSRIMRLDIAADGESLVTAAYDRTFKLWRRGETSYTDPDALADALRQEEEGDEPAKATNGASASAVPGASAAAQPKAMEKDSDSDGDGDEAAPKGDGEYDMPWET
jgi:U4/U6 small nuclear ribonucleoprotein PRP4